MSTLYLIRHGQYDSRNPQQDHLGKGLLPVGEQQAELTGNWLANQLLDVDSIYCSDFTRAEQTATIIKSYFAHIPMHVHKELRECENLYYADYEASPSHFLDSVMSDPTAFFQAREHTTVFFVCHANLIRYLITRYFSLNREQWRNLWLGNCSISTLKLDGKNNFDIDLLASEAHLPRSLWT